MANRTRPTQMKRERERAKQQKRVEKAERRQRAKTEHVERPAGGEDPDIAGIVPGPQPSPWGDDDLLLDLDVEEAEDVDDIKDIKG